MYNMKDEPKQTLKGIGGVEPMTKGRWLQTFIQTVSFKLKMNAIQDQGQIR